MDTQHDEADVDDDYTSPLLEKDKNRMSPQDKDKDKDPSPKSSDSDSPDSVPSGPASPDSVPSDNSPSESPPPPPPLGPPSPSPSPPPPSKDLSPPPSPSSSTDSSPSPAPPIDLSPPPPSPSSKDLSPPPSPSSKDLSPPPSPSPAPPTDKSSSPSPSPPPPINLSPSPPPPPPRIPSPPPPSPLLSSPPPSPPQTPRSPPPPPRSPPPPPPAPPPPSLNLGSPNSLAPSPSPPPPPRQLPVQTPPPYFPRKQSIAPSPQFYAPPPPDKPSSKTWRGAPSKDSQSMEHGPDSGPQAKQVNSRANSTVSSPAPSSGDNSAKYVGYTVAGLFAVALVAVAVSFALAFRRKKSRDDAPYMPPLNIKVKSGANGHYYVQHPSLAYYGTIGSPLDSAQPKSAPIFFTYDMVMEITNAFSSENIIGEGGFGCVFKGWLPDGKGVAVKQLKAGSGQGEREFKAEVEIISRVHHRHLVSLVGYCISEQQRILIYEYVPNGTLHHHLHGSGMPVLDWAKRLKIAIGAAKGLAYLHEDCSQKIIHRDIKSANILLDDAFEAQVADFGLARLADAANTHVSTRVMGTFGYMAPEYATSGKLSDRSDVFSFGVVLLELVTGRKPVDQTRPFGDESLVEWARPLLLRAMETRNFSELVDPRLQNNFVESEMFRMIEAAAACVRHSAPKRPRMVQVVRALDTGDEKSDLSNGVKYGHSLIYDSGQYDKEIMLFKRMANGTFVDSDFDMYSREYSLSRENSRGSQQELIRYSSSGESESRPMR